MLRLTLYTLLCPFTLLCSQSENYVYPDYFHQAKSIVVDTTTGDFYVEHYDQAGFFTNPFVSDYTAGGELR